jgi:hypothetical protein
MLLYKCSTRPMMEKIQANKCRLVKITKNIIDAMHTLKNMMQTFTSKNKIFKEKEGCAMYNVILKNKHIV